MRLSKSSFIRGVQCEKMLYLDKHHSDLREESSVSREAIFEQGTNVGLLAQDLFKGGYDASPDDYSRISKSLINTQKAIENGESIIYEATFEYNGLLSAIDILVKENNQWKAYEVKSSTSVSDTYVIDAAVQYYTIVNSGLELSDISLVLINNEYVRNGEIDLNDFFKIISVKNEVLNQQSILPDKIDFLKKIINKNEIPTKNIGVHCNEPYDCDFKAHCWKHIPEYSIFDISRLKQKKKFKLYNQGIITFDQLKNSDMKFSSSQKIQINSEVHKSSIIKKDLIKNFTDSLNYPLHFLDFETILPAIPLFDNCKPFQQVVFQYSLHVQKEKESNLSHYEYLAPSDIDPREVFIEKLIEDCGSKGDVIVYNISFERGRLNELISIYPKYKEQLNNIINRMKDLMIPFQKKWFYTPEMEGSYSIKYVLPALVSDLSYDQLAIKDGGTASNTFLSMVNNTFDRNEVEERKNLLEYCKMDSFAMVKILDELFQVVKK
jgi:hypothetical protein